MPYCLLDDGFHSDHKIVRAGNEAAGIFARSISYCADNLTDGFVPAWWVRGISGPRRAKPIQALIDNELWRKVKPGERVTYRTSSGTKLSLDVHETGYFIDKFCTHNPSGTERKAYSRAKSEAGKKGANKRWHDGTSDSSSHNTSHDTTQWQNDSSRAHQAKPRNTNTHSAAVSSNAAAAELTHLLERLGVSGGLRLAALADTNRALAWAQAIVDADDITNPAGYLRTCLESGVWPQEREAKPAPGTNKPPKDPEAAIAAAIRNGALTDPHDVQAEAHGYKLDQLATARLIGLLTSANTEEAA